MTTAGVEDEYFEDEYFESEPSESEPFEKDHFKQCRSKVIDLQIECSKYMFIVNKLKENKERIMPFLEKEIEEWQKKFEISFEARYRIKGYEGVIEKVLIPRIDKFKLEIKQLLQLIPSEAVSLFYFQKSYAFFQSDDTSAEVFSNFLISSKLISLLCNEEIDVDTFGLRMASTLKKIEHLHKEIEQVKLHIQKFEHLIDKYKSMITLNYTFNSFELSKMLGVSETLFSEFKIFSEREIDRITDYEIDYFHGHKPPVVCFSSIDYSSSVLYNTLLNYFRLRLKYSMGEYKRLLNQISIPVFDKTVYIATYNQFREFYLSTRKTKRIWDFKYKIYEYDEWDV